MKHVRFSNIALYAFVSVCVLSSCRPDAACREKMGTGLIGELRVPYVDLTQQIQLATKWDSITVVGIGQDEPLYNNSKNISQLFMPLRTTADSTCYTLRYAGTTDTICIYQKNQQRFVSVECGCTWEHTIDSITYTSHWITDIEIVCDSILRNGSLNVVFWRDTISE